MPNDVKSILHRISFFKYFDELDLQDVIHEGQQENFPAGTLIIREGDIGARFYVILSGSVRVFTHNKQGEEIVLARLEAGDYFGEQALLTKKPLRRNASIRTLTPVSLLSYSHDVLQKQLQPNPDLLSLLKSHGEKQLITKLAKQLENNKDNAFLLSLFNNKKHFIPRQIIFRQDDLSQKVYYLVQGSIEIRIYTDTARIKNRTQIQPGQFFGELGVLNKAPRFGTAIALSDVDLFEINGDVFTSAYQQHANLQALMDTMIRIYQIPRLGMMMQYQGIFLGKPAIYMVMQKQNGEIIITTRVIHAEIFAIAYSDLTHCQSYTFQENADHFREIKLCQHQLLSVVSVGSWNDLDEIARLVYEKSFIHENQLTSFLQSGILSTQTSSFTKEGYVCICMQITYSQINALIKTGLTTLTDIAKKTGASTVCGGCRPYIMELLGEDAWYYVRIHQIKIQTSNIRSFQLQLISNETPSYQAGQHVVVSAYINENWVARSYTLTSTEEENYYEITVKKEPKGWFSSWLFNYGKKDLILRISEPQGEFIFLPEKKQPAVCLVAGVGVTPAIAFARKLLQGHHLRKLYIDYSVRNQHEIAFLDEIKKWREQEFNIEIKIRITSEEGRLQQIQTILAAYPDAEYFICGPRDYETDMLQQLKTHGIQSNQIFVETFIHAGGPFVQ